MQLILNGLRSRATSLVLFVGSIWAVSCLGFIFPLKHALGIEPRSLTGLLGILTAPWAHAGFGHLMANTVPLLVLGWLAMLPRQEGFWQAIVGGALGAGFGAWVLGGPNTVHIGASGLVFGLFGFILARGFYARRLVDIAVALPAAALYGVSMFMGLLPVYPGVSWQSHLGGAIGGVLVARYFTRSSIR
ncbi:rhomboid family intramembrane serine protease [Burkholderia ubonensis]|uniref:rhomboid family intramembrane serine protease n=1 Tax=Burkholderia ubonensis TaxID=101571 RepID=UPI00075BA920|nr:rhomboid family intramembrane serine protease [Burkholderia ubonensis]KVP75189.1 rhomboid family intramembrane serine protease [Burkholderia ubonensis]